MEEKIITFLSEWQNYLFNNLERAIKIRDLGNLYEEFISLNPSLRKFYGVYYTPKDIVDYIVENTVGKLLKYPPAPLTRGVSTKNKITPEEISKIKILDPACGSGSFLIGVYEYLLDWHLKYYKKASLKEQKDNIDFVEGKPRLTIKLKKQILLNNIFGVDIDEQAINVTKLSLCLKCLEGETQHSLRNQLALFKTQALPTLKDNVKCGNSLISSDFAKYELGFNKWNEDEQRKINPFNWEREFPQVFNKSLNQDSPDLKISKINKETKSGKSSNQENQGSDGFDAVIGNPPYGASFSDEVKQYLLHKFTNQNYQLDSYLIFLEQSVFKLLRTNGQFGMIIPNPWLTNLLQKNLRKYIFENTKVAEIVHFKQAVFPKVTVDTEIIVFTKCKPEKNIVKVLTIDKGKSLLNDKHNVIVHDQDEWINLNGDVVNIFQSKNDKSLFKKIAHNTKLLEEFFIINAGIVPYEVGKGNPKQTNEMLKNRVYDNDKKETKYHRKFLMGRDINRYVINPQRIRYIKYGEWLAAPRAKVKWDIEYKIFMRQTGDSLIATIDENQYLCLKNMHVLVPKTEYENSTKYFLGLINSKLMNWYYQTLNPEKGEALAEVKKYNVANLPIKYSEDKQIHDQLIKLVDEILDLNEQKKTASEYQIQRILQPQIDDIDKAIDKLVYDLYGLTDEEIQIVKGVG